MKKINIFDIVLLIIFLLVILNTILSYISYNKVINKQNPLYSFKTIKKHNRITYYQGLYKVSKVEEKGYTDVYLKLFFLK